MNDEVIQKNSKIMRMSIYLNPEEIGLNQLSWSVRMKSGLLMKFYWPSWIIR